MKDFVADTCFDRGWRSVERHFNRLSDAAEHLTRARSGGPADTEIIDSLGKLSSKVEIFADNWEHFHLRIEALLREYDLMHLLDEAEEEG
jgi:hypothetical protein